MIFVLYSGESPCQGASNHGGIKPTTKRRNSETGLGWGTESREQSAVTWLSQRAGRYTVLLLQRIYSTVRMFTFSVVMKPASFLPCNKPVTWRIELLFLAFLTNCCSGKVSDGNKKNRQLCEILINNMYCIAIRKLNNIKSHKNEDVLCVFFLPSCKANSEKAESWTGGHNFQTYRHGDACF